MRMTGTILATDHWSLQRWSCINIVVSACLDNCEMTLPFVLSGLDDVKL